MSFWKKLFGMHTSQQVAMLYSKDHPAAEEIAEAEKVAAETIDNKVYGGETSTSFGTMTSFNSVDYFRIKTILDRALEKCPSDPDLVYARSSLHYLALQGEDGMKDREKCLSLAPNHFDARMKTDHFNSWDTIFHIPRWDELQTTLPDLMMKHIEMDHMVQVVRDHLKGAIAVVVPESRIKLAGSSRMRWELRWESTPKGKVAAHYLFLDNGQFQEFFIPHLAEEEPKINSNYWLLRRLANERFCFIVINRGRSVIRNERYLFPLALVKTLSRMGSDLAANGPVPSLSQFQMAAQWYMQNSDESSLKY
jgi:hypothetical protein